MVLKWLAPTLGYILAVGALGVTSKLALRTLSWQTLIMWTGVGYVVAGGVLVALGQAKLTFVHDTPWAMLSGAFAIGGLVSLYLALGTGQASKVVPITAAYPVVTVLLAAVVLAEGLSVAKVAGMALVVVGAIVIATAP